MKKKIRKLSTIVCLSLFFLGLTITAHALTESQVLVTEGRALLFSSGNSTYSGLLAANEKFKAAVTADPSDHEANLFYAVTRILAFVLEEGSGAGIETLCDLFETFGISRSDVDLVEADAPFNEPPEIYDHYDPPDSIPGGEDVRAFLAGPFVTLLDAAIANLNVITDSTFNTILLASEIDDDYDVEVDYGDVLIFKSALYTLKSLILIMTAYDLDIDLRELVVLGNAGVLQIQRDILDEYPNLLSLRGLDGADGAASLTSAREALLNGINAYDVAFDFITGETDDQLDDLFYFESDEDQREADFILTQLTELKSSLDNNQAAVFTTIDETWILTDENNKKLQIKIEKDVNGNFVSGHAWGLDGCDFLFCSGWVEEFTVSDTTVTIEMGSNWWCSTIPIYYALTGTAQYNVNQVTGIEGGSYSWTDCDGVPMSGTFTGEIVSSETESETIDFNSIFGSADKSPLDIRAILPEFDQYGEPVPGTFPGDPVLNGIFPEFTTNQALTDEMNLQPAAVNTSFISGTITCSAYNTSGNIYIWALDGSKNKLGSTYINAPGSYEITGLPVEADVYLFARWDADNNGIRTFGDYVGKTPSSVTVVSGGTTGTDFSINTQIDDSFIMTKPGLYRVFGSNTYSIPDPQYYYGPWDPNEVDWGSDWTFIGESNKTETFNTGQYYKNILIVWHDEAEFNFDAFEDLTAGTAFATNADGTSCGYSWITSGLKNSDTDEWSEPFYFKGYPDGLCARTQEWYGFSVFNMPDDTYVGTGRQLRLTLGSKITGTVTYTGVQTGKLKVLAFYNNASWAYPYCQVVGNFYIQDWNPVDNTQAYEITGLAPGTYRILAYIDADGSPPRVPGEPVASKKGVTITDTGLSGQDLTLSVPVFAFSGQEKVYPVKRGDKSDELYLAFWAQIPDAQSVQVSGPSITTPINLSRDTMKSFKWSTGIPVSDLGGSIQTGTYTFTATSSVDSSTLTTTFELTSVPSTPDPAILVSPYKGTPDVDMIFTTTTPSFTWSTASGALAHKLKIDQNIDGVWIQIYDSGWIGLATTHTAQMPLPEGVPLRWYVDAYDGTDWDLTTAISRSVKQKFGVNNDTINLNAGWSLVSSGIGFNVIQKCSDETKFASVWKWENNKWAVYLPDGSTQTYAESKGFNVLSTISPGEGFWVNSVGSETLSISGTPATGSLTLTSGWNLVGLKSDQSKTIDDLIFENKANIASLWKWNSGAWAVYLPGEDDGGAAYATSKGFSMLSNIELGEGFWVNATQQITLD